MKESLKDRRRERKRREKARKRGETVAMTNSSRDSEPLKTDPLAPTKRSEMRSRWRSAPFIDTGIPGKVTALFLPRESDWSVGLLHN